MQPRETFSLAKRKDRITLNDEKTKLENLQEATSQRADIWNVEKINTPLSHFANNCRKYGLQLSTRQLNSMPLMSIKYTRDEMVDGDIVRYLNCALSALLQSFFLRLTFCLSFPKKLITTIYHHTRWYTIIHKPLEFKFCLENFAGKNIP